MDDYLKSIGLDLSDSIAAAKDLLGYKLVRNLNGKIISGYIVETEAYHGLDPASHTFMGKTNRNKSQFERSGTFYIYFTYGMHFCINVVTGEVGNGQAVLIRALQPIDGIDFMEEKRHTTVLKQLTNGPAKLTQALAIDRMQDGTSLIDGPISIERGFKPKEIVITPRIGITKAIDNPWRFYIKDNPFVSHV